MSIILRLSLIITIIILLLDDFYCEDYPVLNYTLVIINYHSFDMQPHSLQVSTGNLSENSVYMSELLQGVLLGPFLIATGQ